MRASALLGRKLKVSYTAFLTKLCLTDTGGQQVLKTHDLSVNRSIYSVLGWICFITIFCSCQLIGPLERELSGPEEEFEGESVGPTCLLRGMAEDPWWIGTWEIDREHMKVQLVESLSVGSTNDVTQSPQLGERTDTITKVFIESLAEHFLVQVTSQQASLKTESTWKRFPISQLPRQAGVRLTSLEANESSTLWCQGERAYWSAEGGSPLPVKRRIDAKNLTGDVSQ